MRHCCHDFLMGFIYFFKWDLCDVTFCSRIIVFLFLTCIHITCDWKKSLNDFFIQTFISDVFSLIQYEKIYSRLMSSFLCCPLISCQCDSGHMKVVIHFDLRPVLVSMPYVPSWNCGRPPGSVPARTGPTLASCGTGCANQSEYFPWVRAQPSPA